MKNIFATLVTLFVTMTAAAQMVVKSTVWETVVYPGTGIYGYSYPTDKLPGSYKVGVDFNSQLYKNLQEVHSREGYTAYQQAAYNAAQIRPKVVDVTEYVNTMGMLGMGMTGMGMTGMPMMGMYGMGGNQAVVSGAGGMAGGQSTVVVTNQNMLSTIGSSTQGEVNVDGEGKLSLKFGGDLLGALAKTIQFFGKKQQPQQQYQQVQPVQYQQVQPVQPQQQTTNGSATRSNSDVSSGY